MMNYEIRPYIGVGPINFGMSLEEVRSALHEHAEPVDKSRHGIPTDFFRQSSILVYYKPPGICEAVEFGGSASPTFAGQHLLGRSYSEVEVWIKTLDPGVVLDESGLTTYRFGFGVYAPSAQKEPDLPVEGVIVFDKGYYD